MECRKVTVIGVPGRSRTCNLRLRRASRYPIVPRGLVKKYIASSPASLYLLAVPCLATESPAVCVALCYFGIHWRSQLQTRSLATKVKQNFLSDAWLYDKTLLAV